MSSDFEPDEEQIDRSGLIEKVWYVDGVKWTRYHPVWHKDPEAFDRKMIRQHNRKPTFGPKDP